jgi:hypothetical protein
MAKVPHVQRIRRANGQLDLYFRKGGYREGPLQAADGTDALRDEVAAILARIAKAEAAQKPRAGTVGGLLAQYNRSPEFLSNARSTQAEYQRLIDELTEDCGAVLLADVSPAWLRDMREAWALRGHKAANDRRQVLKNALTPAIEDERIQTDPFAKVGKVSRPSDAGESHPTWEDAEVEAAIELAIARKNFGLARAVALGRYGGFRRGTICTIPLRARVEGFDLNGRPERRLNWITEKRKVLADKPEDGRLTALLARTPNQALTIAYNFNGVPWKPRQLNQALDRLIEALAKKGKARDTLTIHGLRHARGVELALAGASDAEIMAQLEHATDRAAKIYRRQADRRKLADAGQKRVDNVVGLRARRKAKAAKQNPA